MPDDLLRTGVIRNVRLDITSRCNLRCVYCAVSQRDYVGQDMPEPVLRQALAAIRRLSAVHELDPIDVNGHGETTIVEGWTDVCIELLSAGVQLRITSNFAKEFSPAELAVLARMNSIAVSIDTADRAALRRFRRRVDFNQILANIVAVRATARELTLRPPSVQFLCGLYDQNALDVERLAAVAVALRVDRVDFWSLTPYDYANTTVAKADRVRPLDALPDTDLAPRLAAIGRAMTTLRRGGVACDAQGDFVTILARRRGLAA